MKVESNIFIRDLRLYAFHGVLEQERRVGGEFSIDVRVHYNIWKAMESDILTDTISYAELCELIRREMAIPSALLEHVAGRIAKAILVTWPEVTAINLCLTKLNPPMGADCKGAGVEIDALR